MNTEKENEYRLFCWTNMYLSQIQRGIQTAHVVSEIARLFPEHEFFLKWAKDDKTIVVYNGGMGADLNEIVQVLDEQNEYPFVSFSESQAALDGALTAVGGILPRWIWEAAKGKTTASFLKDYRMLTEKGLEEAAQDIRSGEAFRWLSENGFNDIVSQTDNYLINLIKESRWA